eukprot:gene14335-20327_t
MAMEPGTRTAVKRCVMALAPVIDFAINNVFLASISASSTGKASRKETGRENSEDVKSMFTLKRMDSGNWGEFSLLDAVERKYKRGSFDDPKKWDFTME